MPLSNPFSPSRIRRRLSREMQSGGKNSPDRSPPPRRHYGAIKNEAAELDDDLLRREDAAHPSSRGGGRSTRGGRRPDCSTSPLRQAQSRNAGSRDRKENDPNVDPGRSPPRRRLENSSPATGSPALPYSKDFGSFDLTLCEAVGGRCIVLVEYEDRVFLNGKQIYIMLDGTVMDREGNPSKVLQQNYDCVLQEKRRLRKRQSGTPTGAKKAAAGGKHGGSTLLHESKDVSRGIFRDGVPTTPSTPASQQSRSKPKTVSRDHDRNTILKDLGDLETSCSKIVGRLCQTILKYSRWEEPEALSHLEEEGSSNGELSQQVQATLSRLIDQFRSVVDLNASLQEHDANDTDVDDEEIIEKWVAEAFGDKDESKNGKRKVEEQKKEGLNAPTAARENVTSTRTVGTQIKERRVEKRDKNLQTERRQEEDKIVTDLREENRLLQNEILAMEADMREMQATQEELEKRFDEETAAKLAAMKQLADLADKEWRAEPPDAVNRIEDLTQTEIVTTESQNEVRSTTTSIATCTVSSVSMGSLSSVSSSDSDPALLQVSDSKEPGICMRQRSRALKSEIGRLRDVYSDVEEQISRLAEENTDLRLRVARLNREGKEARNQMEQANQTREEYKMEIKNLDKVNTQLEAKLAEMCKERKFDGEKLRSATNELSRIDVERRKAERELADLQKRFATLTGEKQRLGEEFGKLEKAHLEASANAARLSKSGAESEVQLGILRGQIGDMTVEIDRLRAENQTNSEARQRAERDNRKLESELRATRKMNGELSAEVMQIKSKVGSAEDTVRHLESDNAKLTQQVVHLEAIKAALSKRAADAEASIRLASATNKDLTAESFRLKRENLELRTTVEEMSMLNTNIRSRLDHWGKDSADIGKKMKQLVGAKAELQDFIQQLTSVNTNIEKRFEKMDSEYADLERRLQTVGTGGDGVIDDGASTTDGSASLVLQELD